MSQILTTGDVARRFNVDPKTAYRLMLEAHQKHGDAVVARRGRRLVTTEAALERVFPAMTASRDERRIASLQEQLDEVKRREAALAEQMRELKASVREEQRAFWKRAEAWFNRHGRA